jgi:hypothetical protein
MSYVEGENTDDLLQRKILERSNMDQIFMKPVQDSPVQSVQSVQDQPPVQGAQGSQSQPLPVQFIEKYLKFNPEEKRRFSLNNPSLYNTIIEELNQRLKGPSTTTTTTLPPPIVSEPVSPTGALGSSFSQLYNNNYENDDDSTSTESIHPITQKNNYNYISLDFRCDVKDIKSGAFVLRVPIHHQKQITYLELESCILPMMPVLENESYIYIDFAEFEGDYVTSRRKVYGKLIRGKQNDSFLHFLPENCKKTFILPLNVTNLTVSFYTYDGEPINLQYLDLQSISKNEKGQSVLHTKCAHYLSEGDSLILSNNLGNKIIVEKIKVLEILDKKTYIINSPHSALSHQNTGQLDATVEKIDLKCTLTLKIQHKL